MKTKQQKQQNKSKWNAERNLVIAKKQAKKQQRKKELGRERNIRRWSFAGAKR
jgi:hypothetical protein